MVEGGGGTVVGTRRESPNRVSRRLRMDVGRSRDVPLGSRVGTRVGVCERIKEATFDGCLISGWSGDDE